MYPPHQHPNKEFMILAVTVTQEMAKVFLNGLFTLDQDCTYTAERQKNAITPLVLAWFSPDFYGGHLVRIHGISYEFLDWANFQGHRGQKFNFLVFDLCDLENYVKSESYNICDDA